MSVSELRSPTRGEVAIVGVACTYPGARTAERFWENIVGKFNAITEVDPEHWDPEVFYDPDPAAEDRLYSKMGGWLPTTFAFNPLTFGIPPATVAASEPDQFLLLRCVFEAINDAGYLKRDFNRERVSIIAGRGNYPGPGQTWLVMRTVVESVMAIARHLRPDLSADQLGRLRQLLKAKIPRLTPEGAAGIIPNVTTGRAANRFDFTGQNFSVDAACASALIATEIGVRNLLTGVDDMTLVGGLHICSQVPFLAIFKATRATSLTSVVRPFDANADGTLGGEGVGMLVLKRLADAERDGDRIYAVIKGVGSASDGRAKHVLAPRVEGEMMAIHRALDMAQISPDTIGLVECHGTATVVGDETEIQALEATYGPAGPHGATCAIGSVKSMIGHTMPAAGAASLIKTALALYHRVLPPTLNVQQPHPRLLDPSCRFYVNTETKPWIQRSDGPPRRAGINAFGFGGINAHVVMEEYAPGDRQSQLSHLREWPTEVVIIEGATREGLLKAMDALREYVIQAEGVPMRDVAYTLNTGLTGGAFRVAIVASSLENLAQKIDRAKSRLADSSCTQIRERTGIFYFESAELRAGKVAFLFPGEGAQYLNMMTDLCLHFPEVRQCFDLGDAAVKDPLRTPLSTLLYPPPAFSGAEEKAAEERLWSLEHGTESVLTANLAMLALTRSLQIRPEMMTGHSVGDWTALSASSIIDFDQMFGSMDRLDRIYQKLKTEIAIPKRAMMAVGAGRERIEELAKRFNRTVEIANDNCPHQVVIVTGLEGAQEFRESLMADGLFVERLPYDGGYHTESFTYMNDPLLQLFRDYSIRKPQVPVYCGMTAAPWPDNPEEVREIASSAYSKPILFTQTIERMYADGARVFIEVGPRGNLTAFVDDILRGKPHLTVPLDLFRKPGLTTLNHGLGMLAAAHVSMDLTTLYQRRAARKLSLDAERDSVQPEDRQPGVVQVSKVYRYLYTPEGDEFPFPAAAASIPPAFAPADPAVQANGHGYTAPETVAASVLDNHFRLMEEFLKTEEDVMARALQIAPAESPKTGFRAAAAHLKNGAATIAPPADAPPADATPADATPADATPADAVTLRQIRSFIRNADIVSQSPGQSITLRITLDLKEHKYLRDHSLTFVATQHNNQGDRIFKMPLTCSIETACEVAALLQPGQHVVSARGSEVVRALQVLENQAAPTIEIAALTQPSGDIDVTIREPNGKPYFRTTVRLAAGHQESPPARSVDFQNPRAPQCSGEEIYTARHMFHGPSFQGVQNIGTMADNGMAATLTILPTASLIASDTSPVFHVDPFLLDAAGQLVGYWPIENCKVGGNVLPIKVQEVNKYADTPKIGTVLECRMVVRSLSSQTLVADYDVILPNGKVWLRVLGWEDWRLYWPDRLFDYAYGRFGRYEFAALPIQNEALLAADLDCVFLPRLHPHERDPLLVESWSSVLCSKRESAIFQTLSPPQQLEWLVERTSAKDAVRFHVKRKYGTRVFPADIEPPSEKATHEVSGPGLASRQAVYCSTFSRDGWSAAAAGSRLSAVSVLESKAAISPGYFTPDEEERLSLPGADEWKRRAVVAKQAAGRYFRPDSTEEFWQTLLITAIHSRSDSFGIADPGSAVNAEDALKVVTAREGDFLVAVAFQS